MQTLLEDQTRTLRASGGKISGAEVDDAPEVVTMPQPLPIPTANITRRRRIQPCNGADQNYLAALNAGQRRAVEYGIGSLKGDGEGPLLIIAGAGSGKTNTLAYRVAHLVFSGVDPHRILLLTFSRRAAEEMVHRAGRVLSQALDARGP